MLISQRSHSNPNRFINVAPAKQRRSNGGVFDRCAGYGSEQALGAAMMEFTHPSKPSPAPAASQQPGAARSGWITKKTRKILSLLFETFGDKPFTVSDINTLLERRSLVVTKRMLYRLRNTGFVCVCERRGSRAYRYVLTEKAKDLDV